jgi:hypothetical protein
VAGDFRGFPGLAPTLNDPQLPPWHTHLGSPALALGPALFSARRGPPPGPRPSPRSPARHPVAAPAGGSAAQGVSPKCRPGRVRSRLRPRPPARPPAEPGFHPRERLKSAQLPPTPARLVPSFQHPYLCSPLLRVSADGRTFGNIWRSLERERERERETE